MYARMVTAMERTLERSQSKFQLHLQKLNTLNPLSTLERGYAIVSTPEGHIIKQADEVSPGNLVKARLAEGQITAEVRSIAEKEET